MGAVPTCVPVQWEAALQVEHRTESCMASHQDAWPDQLWPNTDRHGQPARKHLPAEEWKLVCEGMCHNIATANRFHTAVPDIQDVFRIQDLPMKAMEQYSLELSNQSSDSEKDSLPSTGDRSTETQL
ncbi:hypothetical protein MHYP_G00111100 [Metynnis hypsauchen]